MTDAPLSPAPDLAAFADCLFEPDDLIEVRRLPSGRSTWHRPSEFAQIAATLERENKGGEGIYIGVNPRRHKGGKDAASVLLARCLFVDFDNMNAENARGSIKQAELQLQRS
jgi:hypothetical protein